MALRGFRFHLSTAVLLMFAAGGLIGLNLNKRFMKGASAGAFGEWHGEVCFGFPVSAWIEDGNLVEVLSTESEFRAALLRLSKEDRIKLAGVQFIQGQGYFFPGKFGKFSPFGVAIDTLFAVAVLFIVALISEYLILRSKPLSLNNQKPETRNQKLFSE